MATRLFIRVKIGVSGVKTKLAMNDLRLTNKYYYMIWDKFGPFKYDIMASATNVKCDEKGNKLRFFSRYFQKGTKGWMCLPKT